MTASTKLAIAAFVGLGVAGAAFANPSRALVSMAQQAAASSIAPSDRLFQPAVIDERVGDEPVIDDPVVPPTNPSGPTITPNLPNTVTLLPITIRPPFRPDIRSPFTP
ncbi:MAG TPA: hypothetical protein PLD59_10040 [Tepidisphaeraceae bacterium]|nr:hypothetical protein [Tepidisphaeraceae bacterium]